MTPRVLRRWPFCIVCGLPMAELTRLVESQEWCHWRCADLMEDKERREAATRWATT